MKSLKSLLQKLFSSFSSFSSVAVSILVGVSAGLMVYLNLFQRHYFSKLYLGYTILITFIATILTAFLREYYLKSKFRSLSKSIRILVLLFSIFFAFIILVNFQTVYHPIYILLPESQLQIRIPADVITEESESIRLLRIDTGQGYIHYSNLDIEGEWAREGKNIVFQPGQEVVINWSGKVGPSSEIVFRKTTDDQRVTISWNGREANYNLNQSDAPNVLLLDQLDSSLEPDYVIRDENKTPFVFTLPLLVSSMISIGFVSFTLLIFLGTQPIFSVRKQTVHRCSWLIYMLPMIIVWGFSFLTFWPGIVSNDSLTSWTQAVTGQFTDWQSAFYSLVLSWLMSIWYSPAIVSIIQILVLAYLVAWGLKALQDIGVPPIILFAVSILFAVFPINNLYIITLWRDVPYAIAFLWLTVLITKVFLGNGEWIKKGWLWLALAAFLISILRQNGIPVAVFVLVVLIPIYQKFAKEFLKSLIVFLCLLLFFKGPVYSLIKMDRSKSGQENLILLHHIAAHLDAGTELSIEEEEYLNALQPIPDWFYYSCYVGTISYDDQFAREDFLVNSAQNREIALNLFLKAPMVDVHHTLNASEMVWRFVNNQCIMKSLHGFSSWKPGDIRWVIPNDLDITQDSKIPSVVQPYVDFLRVFGIRDDFLVPYLRPALYLYLSVFCTVVLMIRKQDARSLLLGLPIFSQFGLLFLISYAPAVRYQYSNILVGLFLLPMLFISKIEKTD